MLSEDMSDDDEDDVPQYKSTRCSPLKDIYHFYNAPITKYNGNLVCYVIFLLLYSYIMLIKLEDNRIHWTETILSIWVLCIFLEEIKQLTTMHSSTFISKLHNYFHDHWNIPDLVSIFLFIIGMIFRSFMTTETMAVARIVLSISLITFFVRGLHFFSANKRHGFMLVVITDMVKDLMWFVVILLVFMTAYAIASESILYPNSELSWKLFYYLPRKAYWHIYGETLLEDVEGTSACTNDPALYRDYSTLRCPSESGKYFVPILMGVYMMLTSVMLLNLLIAMFSYTFQNSQSRLDMYWKEHWCYQRFSALHEYANKPVLPPPFSIFSHLVSLLFYCVRKYRRRDRPENSNSAFGNDFDDKVQKRLIQWENNTMHNYFSEKKPKIMDDAIAFGIKNQGQAKGISGQEHAAVASSGLVVLGNRMDNMEVQLTLMSNSFDWIKQALHENNMAPKKPTHLWSTLEDKTDETRRQLERCDAKNKRLVDMGILPFLVIMVNSGISDDIKDAIECLSRLHFHRDNKVRIVQEPGLIKGIKWIKDAPQYELRMTCDILLWSLREQLEAYKNTIDVNNDDVAAATSADTAVAADDIEGGGGDDENDDDEKSSLTNIKPEVPPRPPTPTFPGHVMISYQWGHQELIKRIADELKDRKVPIWLDIYDMTGAGGTLEAMATAVEGAFTVIVAMSSKYKHSPNCRAECEYAYMQKKTIIPILVEKGYRADGWLGIMTGPQLYYNFSEEERFESAMNQLHKAIINQAERSN